MNKRKKTNRRSNYRRPYRTPVMAPGVIKEFMARKLDDWRWIKDVPRDDLLEIAKELGFSFHTKPNLHQLACWVLCSKLHRFGLFLDMGGGKTKLVLDLIRYRKMTGELRGALVCVPNLINLPSWEDQIKQHAPDLTYRLLEGSRAQRFKALEEIQAKPVDLCLINYAGLPVYMAKAASVRKRGKTGRLDAVRTREFCDVFNFVAIDEPHLVLSSSSSLTFDLAKTLSNGADFCYGLTGTLFGRDPMKAWPQMNIIDQGETLGHTLGLFQLAYFTPKEDYFAGIKWEFNKRLKKHLQRTLQHRSIRYEDSEFSDLPQLMPSKLIQVKLDPAQLRRYADILHEAREAKERGERQATWIRLRQTTSGFISVKGEDSEKLEMAFSPNPKADALMQYLLELPEDEKVVVFHEYVASGRIIQDVLKRMKIKFAGVGSGFGDVRLQRETFMTAPSCRVWVANSKAGATGADGLQSVARHLLFYETPTSPDRRKQAIKRLFRAGQMRRVYVADLVAANVAIDKRILESVDKGQDLFDAVCNGHKEMT